MRKVANRPTITGQCPENSVPDNLVPDNSVPDNSVLGQFSTVTVRYWTIFNYLTTFHWNILGQCLIGESRTINNLETFHSTLVKIFSSNHPNIWILIEALKSEDELAKTKLQKLKQGEEVLRKSTGIATCVSYI